MWRIASRARSRRSRVSGPCMILPFPVAGHWKRRFPTTVLLFRRSPRRFLPKFCRELAEFWPVLPAGLSFRAEFWYSICVRRMSLRLQRHKVRLRGRTYPPTPRHGLSVPKRFGTDRATLKGRGGESAQADFVRFETRFQPPKENDGR